MARNESLPAHLQGRDSRGKENLTLYEHHEPNSTNDIVWAFIRENLTLLGSSRIVSLH